MQAENRTAPEKEGASRAAGYRSGRSAQVGYRRASEPFCNGEQVARLVSNSTLLAGPLAAFADPRDLVGLGGTPQPLRRRPAALNKLGQRFASGPDRVADEIDELGGEAVAGGAPFVLGDQRSRLDRPRALGEGRRKALSDRSKGRHVGDTRLRVEHAQLDGAEIRVRTHVPPQKRVVVEQTGVRAVANKLLEVCERAERRRQAAARHGLEDLAARRREARVAPLPERGVRRQ